MNDFVGNILQSKF